MLMRMLVWMEGMHVKTDYSGSNVSIVSTRACSQTWPVTVPVNLRVDSTVNVWPRSAHVPVVKRVSQPTEICSIFHKCEDMQTSMGTNFGDAPNRLKPFNEHDLAIQHAFAHNISTRTGCPSVFFSCGFGQVYRNEFESRRCCYYYRVIIIILLSPVGGQINNNNTIIIITRPWIGPIPP